MELSLIIPAYNEEKIIKNTLKKVLDYLSKQKYSWEVIVVDDGSFDKTPEIVKKISKKKKRVSLVKFKKNKGKGAALRAGFLKAEGNYIIYSDADLSVDIKNIKTFLDKLKKFDVVIASRRVGGAKIAVRQPILRETMGRFYTKLTSLVIGMNIADYTCGFKGFTKDAAKKIFKNSLVERWAYDSEVLFLVKKYGYKIEQVPITWINREDTRVNLSSVILESFKDLLAIRANDFLGKYNNK